MLYGYHTPATSMATFTCLQCVHCGEVSEHEKKLLRGMKSPSMCVCVCVRQGCNIFLGFEFMQAKKADGARRNVRDVVEYLITIPDVKEAIKADGSKVKLRFAADGRRTSKRIGTVMAVFNILSEGKQTYEYQYTLALYNGKWKYSSF